MDPILQKRLIGAFILIVAAIVFIPMLLDGPGPAGTETVDLGIPSPGPDGMRTEMIPLDAPLPAAPLADEGEVDAAAIDDSARLASETVAAGESMASAEPLPSDPVDVAPEGDLPPPDDTAPADLVDSGHAADSSGRWHVTLGSYANADNARKLVADMRSAGFPARAEAVTLAGKPALRVRIGPYSDQVRAESARLAVAERRRDVTPALVQDDSAESERPAGSAAPLNAADSTPAPASPAAASDATPAPSAAAHAPVPRDARGWVVQTGAFSQVGEADAQVARLRAAGFAAFIDRLDAPRGTLHRVRIGPEIDRAGAERLQASLKQGPGVDGVVMRHP